MGTANPGFSTTFYKTGAAVSMTDEATTELTGTTFQITDANRRILDPSASFVVDVDATPASSSTFEIDYLHGVIIFDSSQTGSTVTVTGDFLPYYEIKSGYSLTFSMSYEQIDSTEFDSTAFKRVYGLADVSGEFSTFEKKEDPLDGPAGSEESMQDIFNNGTRNVVSVELGDGDITYRAWVGVEGVELTSSPDGREEWTWSYVGDQQAAQTADQVARVFRSNILY